MPDSKSKTDSAITLEVLPAGYGDCLLVSCPTHAGTWRLLMDTGPDETWPALQERLSQIPRDQNGHRNIDLAIISHIDHDHIGAARSLFKDQTLGLRFGDIWFNGRCHLGYGRGVAEAESLTATLSVPERELPWNSAFGGAAVAIRDGFFEVLAPTGCPRITLLSPTSNRLERLIPKWDAELAMLRAGRSNTEQERAARSSQFPDLDALAVHDSRLDSSVTNGSSIAILLEHRGASALLAADAFPADLGSALVALAKRQNRSFPLRIDILKLSHHGSRANFMKELAMLVRATHFVVSTNNDRFGHPDDEALARLVVYGGKAKTLWFNYATSSNLRWSDRDLQRKYGFRTRFPKSAGAGVTLMCREVVSNPR